MPVKTCSSDGKSGFKWGDSGKCYTHDGSDAGKARAKKLAVKQAIAIGGGSMPKEYAAADADTRLAMDTLETVDLEGVEIAAADVRVFGSGACAPGGEVYTVGGDDPAHDLARIAEDTNRVLSELKPKNRLGHASEQRLLSNSGMLDDDDENPGVGRLENFRVSGKKLVADAKAVPKKLAELFEAGAFHERSPGIGPFLSQQADEILPAVVHHLGWLGTTPPAFQTLDDVAALYAGRDRPHDTAMMLYADARSAEGEDSEIKLLRYAAGDVIWDPEAGFQDVMDDLRAILNPGPGDYRYWVMDVATDLSRAMVQENGSGVVWVAPITIGADKEPVLAPSTEWTMAEQAWVEAENDSIASYARGIEISADTRTRMDGSEDKNRKPGETPDEGGETGGDSGDGTTTEDFSADERGALRRFVDFFKAADPADGETPDLTKLDPLVVKTFAAAAGVPDETDPAKIVAAVEARKRDAETPIEQRVPEGMKLMAADEVTRLTAMAQEGVEANAARKALEKDTFLKEFARRGKLDPSDFDHFGKLYESDPELAKTILDKQPVREEIVRTYGAEGRDELERSDMSEEQYAAYCAATGIPYVGPLNDVQTNAGAKS